MVIYKIVLDMMDRYLMEFDGPHFKIYRNKLIPFAMKFYKMQTKKSIEYLSEHLKFFKSSYNSKLIPIDNHWNN
jgi:hypothetical protein